MYSVKVNRYYSEDVNSMYKNGISINVYLNYDWEIHEIYVRKIHQIMRIIDG